ncbi:MAG: hypothetical protein Q4F84_07750 [Fibrobacter sp.]|nr:hypothetical protein [Fibrobacter sp.]
MFGSYKTRCLQAKDNHKRDDILKEIKLKGFSKNKIKEIKNVYQEELKKQLGSFKTRYLQANSDEERASIFDEMKQKGYSENTINQIKNVYDENQGHKIIVNSDNPIHAGIDRDKPVNETSSKQFSGPFQDTVHPNCIAALSPSSQWTIVFDET